MAENSWVNVVVTLLIFRGYSSTYVLVGAHLMLVVFEYLLFFFVCVDHAGLQTLQQKAKFPSVNTPKISIVNQQVNHQRIVA